VKIVPIPWGGTPDTGLNRENPEHSMFYDRIIPGQIDANNKPDIFIHLSIPIDFQPAGKFNIGITAGIECTKMRPEWIDGCNKMDLIITTSRFSAEVFKINKFEKRNKQTNQVEGLLELLRPIEVLFEGFDPDELMKLFQRNRDLLILGVLFVEPCFEVLQVLVQEVLESLHLL
jgi:hypothetical protein